MCMYTRHEIFLPKQWRIQLVFDNCFDINVRKIEACIIWNLQYFLKMNKDMNKIK